MKREKEFEDILEECLERLLVKGETIDQCLQSYPEHAAELEPLLQTAADTRQTMAIEPRPEFRARARQQLQSALETAKPKRGLSWQGWMPQWAVATAIILVLMVAGGSTVSMASYSMPGSFLYPVKLATEQVQLALTTSTLSKVELYAKLADRRVAEIVSVANSDNTEQIEPTAQRLDDLLEMMAELPSAERTEDTDNRAMLSTDAVEPPPELAAVTTEDTDDAPADQKTRVQELVKRYASQHPAELRAALEKAPESAKPVLRQAIDSSVTNYRRTLDALDETRDDLSQ